jgi:hypothetical protein
MEIRLWSETQYLFTARTFGMILLPIWHKYLHLLQTISADSGSVIALSLLHKEHAIDVCPGNVSSPFESINKQNTLYSPLYIVVSRWCNLLHSFASIDSIILA